MTLHPLRRRSSIAAQVWGLVLAAGLVLASLILVNTRADQARERANVTSDLDLRLEQGVSFLSTEVEAGNETEQTLAQIAEQPDVVAGGAACVKALEGLQRAIDHGYLEVVDASGRVLCSPDATHRAPGARWAGATALLSHVAARRTATDAPLTDPGDGTPMLFTVVPLASTAPTSLLYVASTQYALSPDDVADAGVEWLAVDRRTRTVLMRSPEREGAVGAKASATALSAVGADGLVAETGLDGVARLYRGAQLGDSEFVLLVGEEREAAFASARRNLVRNLAFGGLLLLVLAGLGVLLQRRVVRPARRLKGAIELAGRGEDAQAPTDGPSELAALGVAFNEMLAARRRYEGALAHRARHDSLTGLPNRAQVTERLAELVEAGTPCAAVFVDLDRFKLVNDSHGHAVGDEVLVAVGRSLVAAVRPHDVVGRFGGDEFVVVAAGIGAEEAVEVAERVGAALAEPLEVEGRELFVSGSVGVAVHVAGEGPETVLRHADTAMYRAKESGIPVAVFDAAMREDARRLLRTETDLHRALERDELRVHLQPVIDLRDGTVLGAEALVRWQHPDQGLVPPLDFVPVAERTGLIVPIGAWVLREACHWAAVTSERSGRPVAVSVNVSPRQVSQPDFVSVVSEALAETGLAPGQLTLEVTETLLVQDPELATEALGRLRARGVRIALDDFGTGWSSLTYLQTLPVDEIKLDRSYVSRVPHDATAATIVASLVGMAHALGLTVTAEGVETLEQLRYLQLQDCGKAQGYLFQRPVEAAVLEPQLARTDWLSAVR